MLISVVNFTHGKVTDEELQRVVRAINRQISEDFEPYWSMGARLRVDGRSVEVPNAATFEDLRGDAILYLANEATIPDALGFHDANFSGVPFGFVFRDLAEQFHEPWSITMSHEALELIADPEANLLVAGPHPDPNEDRSVFFWYEMCDAVQSENYEIDGVQVSNFVLPLYFTGTRNTDEPGARNDFLGNSPLRSFGVKPGGYVGFFDPATGQMETFADHAGRARLEIKARAGASRRALRYTNVSDRAKRKPRYKLPIGGPAATT
jgi:hypothetical protein